MNNCPVSVVKQEDVYADIKAWVEAQGIAVEYIDRDEVYEMFCIENASEETCDAMKRHVETLIDKYPNTLDFDKDGDVVFGEEEHCLIIYPCSRYNLLSVYSW